MHSSLRGLRSPRYLYSFPCAKFSKTCRPATTHPQRQCAPSRRAARGADESLALTEPLEPPLDPPVELPMEPLLRRARSPVTPLMHAAIKGELTSVRKLLAAGSFLGGRTTKAEAGEDDAGVGMLAACGRRGRPGSIAACSGEDGHLALGLAAHRGHIAVVRELLSARADPASPNGFVATTALEGAASRGHAEVVTAILAASTPDSRGPLDQARLCARQRAAATRRF